MISRGNKETRPSPCVILSPVPGAPLLAFEKWSAENRNRALRRQHRGPLLKKREKWRTPQLVSPKIKGNPR